MARRHSRAGPAARLGPGVAARRGSCPLILLTDVDRLAQHVCGAWRSGGRTAARTTRPRLQDLVFVGTTEALAVNTGWTAADEAESDQDLSPA